MDKERLYEIVGLRKEGLSQKEIAKRIGFSKGYVSACIKVYDTLIGDVEKKRRNLEEEKENIRESVEETKARKRKVEELKKREKELQAKVNESWQVSVAAKNEVKRVREEYFTLKEECNALKREKEKVKKLIGKADDYQKRKKELESEYKKLKNNFEADLARYDVFRGDLGIMEEQYKHIKEGVKDELIPVFLKLSPREKADLISYLLPNELSEMIELVIKRKMLEDIARRLS